MSSWSARLPAEAARTLDELEKCIDELSPDLRAAAYCLLNLRSALMSRIAPSALEGVEAFKMRYHGDYHLAQVLRVENDFVITDFEGEPGRSLEEREEKHSHLRDVAGMLCSFSYLSAVAANHMTMERPADRHRVGPIVQSLEEDTSAAFLSGYRNSIGAGENNVLPSDPDKANHLIGFFVIEKALYELRYEMNNRPDWLPIPLYSLIRALEDKEAHYDI